MSNNISSLLTAIAFLWSKLHRDYFIEVESFLFSNIIMFLFNLVQYKAIALSVA